MARHRSPRGRSMHLGFPLPALSLATGVGGTHRCAAPALSQRGRVAVTAVASTALALGASAGITQLVQDRAAVRLGLEGANASTAPAGSDVDPLAPVQPVAALPVANDASALVKAADLPGALVPNLPSIDLPALPRLPQITLLPGGFARPADGRVTSGFGSRNGVSHFGMDIANKIGTPIRVVAAGVVVEAGPASGFGLWVRVRHDDGTITVYGHVNRFFAKKGERVKAGQVIAEIGNRGQSTGPHLHLEVWSPNGTKLNPRTWLDQRGIDY